MKNKAKVRKPKVLKSKSLLVAKPNLALKPIEQLIGLSEDLKDKFDLKTFPKLATEALKTLSFNYSFDEFEHSMTEWLLQLPKLPDQVNLYNIFGEPSVSVFNNGKFSIDIYFWRKNDTLIHSHGFRGAFKVLYGNSLHEEFSVETTDDLTRKSTSGPKIVPDVLSSSVKKNKYEILKKGDSRTINPGMDLVHRVLHLDNPTVTLCIRSVNENKLSQWHHLSSGISYRQCNIDELTIKRILYFQFLFQSNPESSKSYLNHMLGLISIASQLALYEGLFSDEFGLEPEVTYFMIDQMRARFEDLKWFTQYEEHYKKMNMSLFETEASSGPMKLLAHAINEDYSPEDVVQMLQDLGEKMNPSQDLEQGHILESLFVDKNISVYRDLKDVAQLLFNEEQIFNEEHYEYQQNRIVEFAKKIVNNEKSSPGSSFKKR